MKKCIFFILMVFLTCNLFSQNNSFVLFTDEEQFLKENMALILDFENRVKKIEPSFSLNGLRAEIEKELPYAHYVAETNTIRYPMWTNMPPPVKEYLYNLAGNKIKGERFSALLFFGFFLPHEVGHAFQHQVNIKEEHEYDNEYEASKIALLYWRDAGKDRELKEIYHLCKQILVSMKNPVPPDQSAEQYFRQNFGEVSQDLDKDIYMVLYQITSLFEDKDLPDFNTYIKNALGQSGGQ